MNDDFEQQLRDALHREQPPAWFEARVLSAVREQETAPAPWFGLRWRWSLALAAVLVIAVVGWMQERATAERAAGEAAKARLELALRITSAKLKSIQHKVRDASQGDSRL